MSILEIQLNQPGKAAAIVGCGETAYVRRGTRSVLELSIEAAERALADAGISGRDVDCFVTEGAVTPNRAPIDEVASALGIRHSYSHYSVGSYGAGIAASHLLASELLVSGRAGVVLSFFGADWGSRTGDIYGAVGSHDSMKWSLERTTGYFGQPIYFAAMATRYAALYGCDVEEALCRLAVDARRYALANGCAQSTRPLSEEDYRNSPLIATPLRVADLCLLTDGAGATVSVAHERVDETGQVPVWIAAGMSVGLPIRFIDFFSQNPEYLSWPGAHDATHNALTQLGLGLGDLDFAELYDCSTISLLLQLEDIGLCDRGQAAAYLTTEEDGTLTSGKLPINTHGGLLAHSYVLGIAHIIEAVRQLRGTAGACQVAGARTGLVGLLAGAQYCTLVLTNWLP
jgi:acetyl-CoA acetyltransferase